MSRDASVDRNRDIRAQLLLELYGARPVLVTVTGLHRRLKRAQFDFSPDEIERELSFLVGQQLAQSQTSSVTGENRYGITPAGVIEHEGSL